MPRLTKIDVFSCATRVPRGPGNARARDGAEARQHDLAAVRVARQHRRDVERRGLASAAAGRAPAAARVARRRAARARCRSAAASRTGCRPGRAVRRGSSSARPRVLQHRDAVSSSAAGMSRSSSWLPRMAKTPCGASSGAQQLGDRLDERAIAEGHVVAAEHDQIRLLRHAPAAPRARRRRPAPCALWWMSVRKPMRSPSSAGGRPETGSAALGDAEPMALVRRRRTRSAGRRRCTRRRPLTTRRAACAAPRRARIARVEARLYSSG